MKQQTHIAELDGLRAVAIGFVMLFHFGVFVPTTSLERGARAFANIGWIGVDLFFVLSGMLITGICLDHRGPGFFRAFYARRALRIVPVYAALLGAITVVTRALPAGLGWLATFTTNARLALTGDFSVLSPSTWHLWTLAVEEQFYVVWPLTVSLVSPRGVGRLAAALVPTALAIRIGLFATGASPLAAFMLMPARMDSLALGAALAVMMRDATARTWISDRLSSAANARRSVWVCIAVAVTGMLAVGVAVAPESAIGTVGLTLIAILSATLVAVTLVAPEESVVRRTLRHGTLTRVGRYSYAMYLVHVPVNVVARYAGIRPNTLATAVLYVLAAGGVTYGLAALSWRMIERPALRQKRRFPYGSGREVRMRPPMAA